VDINLSPHQDGFLITNDVIPQYCLALASGGARFMALPIAPAPVCSIIIHILDIGV